MSGNAETNDVTTGFDVAMYDVAIVGRGNSAALTALALAQNGFSVWTEAGMTTGITTGTSGSQPGEPIRSSVATRAGPKPSGAPCARNAGGLATSRGGARARGRYCRGRRDRQRPAPQICTRCRDGSGGGSPVLYCERTRHHCRRKWGFARLCGAKKLDAHQRRSRGRGILRRHRHAHPR